MKKIASINSTLFLAENKKVFNTFVCLGKNFIQIAVTDKKYGKIEALESYQKETGNITRSEAMEVLKTRLVQDAEKVFVGLESKKSTLVPNELFTTEKKNTYLQELFVIENKEIVATQKIDSLKCHSIYTLKEGTQKLIEDEIKKNAIIFHAPSSLLVAYKQVLQPNKKLTSFVRLQEDEILITIFNDKALQLHQTYDIENIEDAYYYYLNALEKLGHERNKMNLSIFGNHAQLEVFKKTMEENLQSVKLSNRLPNLQYTDEIFSHPAHHFFNLFSLVLCV